MSGFFPVDRDWRDNPLFRGDYTRGEAWLWLLENACWKPTKFDVKGKTITLDRGQLCASRDYLAKVWGWSSSAVERFLVRLQTEQMIGRETGQGKSVITISNYTKNQSENLKSGQEIEQETGQRSDRDRTAKEQGNKEIREEEPNGSTPHDLGDFVEPDLVTFKPEDVFALWNRNAPSLGLAKAKALSAARRKHAKVLIEKYGADAFTEAIGAIERSAFLRGETESGWKANFDFFLQPSSFLKLIEGSYDRSSRAKSRSRYEPDGPMAYLQRDLGIGSDYEPAGSSGQWDDREPEGGNRLPYS